MIRVVLALSLLTLTASMAQPGHAETPVECDSKTTGGDYYEIRCPLNSVGATEWRFRAYFMGVHDDTGAEMTVRVDGQEVACGSGSTTQLSGEGDEGSPGGDGLLECRLVLEGRALVQQQLLVVLKWKHAQHVRHELVVVSRH